MLGRNRRPSWASWRCYGAWRVCRPRQVRRLAVHHLKRRCGALRRQVGDPAGTNPASGITVRGELVVESGLAVSSRGRPLLVLSVQAFRYTVGRELLLEQLALMSKRHLRGALQVLVGATELGLALMVGVLRMSCASCAPHYVGGDTLRRHDGALPRPLWPSAPPSAPRRRASPQRLRLAQVPPPPTGALGTRTSLRS